MGWRHAACEPSRRALGGASKRPTVSRCVALTHWLNEAVPEGPSWGRHAEVPGAGVLGEGDQHPRARPRQGALGGPVPWPPGCRAQREPDLLTPPGTWSPWGLSVAKGHPSQLSPQRGHSTPRLQVWTGPRQAHSVLPCLQPSFSSPNSPGPFRFLTGLPGGLSRSLTGLSRWKLKPNC